MIGKKHMLFLIILLLFMSFVCFGKNNSGSSTPIQERKEIFIKDLNNAKEFYQKKEYQKAISILEKHLEIIFYGPAVDIYEQMVEANNLLGDCYLRLGNLYKAYDLYQETNGASDYSDSYALYNTALFTFLFNDTNSVVEILKEMGAHKLTPDYNLYTLLNWVIKTNEGKNIPQKIQDALKSRSGLSANGQLLVDYLLGKVDEQDLITETKANDIHVIKYFIGLKNEKILNLPHKAKEYYLAVYDQSNDLYKWLAAQRLGIYAININNYKNYYNHGKEWTFIRSSSTLYAKNNPYKVQNIIDNDIETAWVEGKTNDGIGEWVEFQFEPVRNISAISIINGYAKSSTIYKANNRIKKVQISFNDGTFIEAGLKDDQMGPQLITLPKPQKAQKVRITILDVYKGAKYSDTCISEIKL